MRERLRKRLSSLMVLVLDWGRYEVSFRRDRFLRIHNRMERIGEGPGSLGYVCLWPFTSRLKAVEEWKFLGNRLLKRTLDSHTFSASEYILPGDNPVVTIVIGHRGMERLPLLQATLKSIGAQKGVSLECIVVEQDCESKIKSYLPPWVRYILQKNSGGDRSYNRSAAFNLGAACAKGRILILHDNDMLMPEMYAYQMVRHIEDGYEAVNIKRFVFYLSKDDTDNIIRSFHFIRSCKPSYVVQNLEAGGSIAIVKKAYMEIGGMDEDFIGWGGEDNEFWSRCSVLRKWIWGYAPIIHLWHKSQPLKEEKNNVNLQHAKYLDSISVKQRIDALVEKNGRLWKSADL